MKANLVAPSARPLGPESKAETDRVYKNRLIKFGMIMKAKADGYGIEWEPGERFETFLHRIDNAELWARGPRETL